MPRLRAEAVPMVPPVVADEAARSPFWWLRYVPTIIVLLLVADLLYIFGSVALVPILASFGLAYVLNPVVERIEERRISRPLAAGLALTIVTAVLIIFLTFVLPDLWNQGLIASQKLLAQFTPEQARERLSQLRQLSPFAANVAGPRLFKFLSSPQELINYATTFFTGSLTSFLSTAAASADLLLVPFFVYYILVDFRSWRTSIEDLIPPRFRGPSARLLDEIGRILQSYVLGQLLIALVMAVLYAIGFAIFQVPAWAGIAALAGFLNVVPYVGTILGLVLACGFTLAGDPDLWRIGGVVLVFIVVQCIEGYYLTPRILGGRLSLHPMAVFLGLLVGGKLFGFLGILLAVPSIAILQVVLKVARELYRDSYFYHQGLIAESVPAHAPAEERLAKAAEQVLTDQVNQQEGDELLAPTRAEDDPVARR